MGFNILPRRQEKPTFQHQENYQFADGNLVLGFSAPGDRVVLGLGSQHKYAREFHSGSDMALVVTDTTRIGIGDGLVVDMQTGAISALQDESLDLTIGESARITGVDTGEGKIAGVALRYKSTAPDDFIEGYKMVAGESPFTALSAMIHEARQQFPDL